MLKRSLPLLLGALVLSGCAASPAAAVFFKQVPVQTAATAVTIPDEIRTSLYDLSTELTADYFKTGQKQNQIFSPLSLWSALGVLREGATGETRAELDAMMKVSADFDSAAVIPDLSRALNFMTESKLSKEPAKNGILLTNGIFFDQRFAKNIKQSFWEKAADTWGAETAQVDFTKEAATKEIIRQWVSDNTESFIDDYKATFATDGTAILNIYNVLYLKDQWVTPFYRLEDETFRTPGGAVKTSFIQRTGEATYVDNDKAQAVAWPGETGLTVWFLLPKAGGDPVSLVPDLQAIMAQGESTQVEFKAPVLDLDGENLSLKDLLQSKGYRRLFTDAQLDEMLTDVDANVSEIKQKTKLEMDEKGFKAAAVTEIGVTMAGMPVKPVVFSADRPYLVVIEYQGMPLFIAQIQDPTEQ